VTTELTDSAQNAREIIRTLELSVADEPYVPHSGWTHFCDLVVRGVLPHAANFGWPVDGQSLDPLADVAVRSGRNDRVVSALVDLSDELGGLAWAYVTVPSDRINVNVGSSDRALLDRAREWFRERFPETVATESTVPIAFWSLGPHGATRRTRSIEVPAWPEIAGNYPRSVRAQLDPLLRGRPPVEGGQLILWHGVPGAGKTHVVRALAWEWRAWCDVHYVTDPEEFFGRAAYMLDVLLNDEYDDDEDGDRWRVLVLEDTGELLSSDAKERTGQGLSRFLNVADGILGQGLRLRILVTTNELLRHLHPAVARPGRCAAAVQFEAFAADEAARWLAARGLHPEEKERTLAELYAVTDGRTLEREQEQRKKIGF
jgi:hypothetical protein